MKPLTEPEGLQAHITSTYFSLRVATAILGFALPPALYAIGRWSDVPLLGSMSDYYVHGTETTRNIFVGGLFAIGACLYAYKGYSPVENVSLNVAGALAPLVALFPCRCGDVDARPTPHGMFAVSFFLVMAFVCIKCAPDTLALLEDDDPAKARAFKRAYRVIGVLLVLSPGIAAVVSFLSNQHASLRFFLELIGVYMFSTYWVVKSRELTLTAADELATRGQAAQSSRGVVKTPAGRAERRGPNRTEHDG